MATGLLSETAGLFSGQNETNNKERTVSMRNTIKTLVPEEMRTVHGGFVVVQPKPGLPPLPREPEEPIDDNPIDDGCIPMPKF